MYSTLSEFYKSAAWRKCMAAIKAQRLNDEGMNICEHCGKPIVKAYDCIGHHVQPLTIGNVNNPDAALNPDNIQLLHHSCHNEVHNRFNLYIPQKVYIVHGSPLAGKSTFVRTNKSNRDLVVDLDAIWMAITAAPLYEKNNSLRSNVFEVRSCLLDMIRTRKGDWQSAWVIGSYPSRSERERLADRLGAELIHIDTSKEECMQRLQAASDRPVSIWAGYINSYFNNYVA